MASGIASQDLPASILMLKDYEPPSGAALGTDEGRAMGEIIADVAPGAALAFYTAWNGKPISPTGSARCGTPGAR